MSFAGPVLAGAQFASNLTGGKSARRAAKKQAKAIKQVWSGLKTSQIGLARQALGAVEGAGQTARADILANQRSQGASAAQHLTSSGLLNTTVRTALDRSITNSTNRSLGQLHEQLGLMRASIFQNLSSQLGQSAAGMSGAIGGVSNQASPVDFLGPLGQLAAFQRHGGWESIFGFGGGSNNAPAGGGYGYTVGGGQT